MDIQSVIDQLKALHPQAIILFGSAARGATHANSDVDVLLIKDTNLPFTERIREVHRSLTGETPVDVIVLRPDEIQKLRQTSSFFATVFDEGKLLYGKL